MGTVKNVSLVLAVDRMCWPVEEGRGLGGWIRQVSLVDEGGGGASISRHGMEVRLKAGEKVFFRGCCQAKENSWKRDSITFVLKTSY